MASLITALEGRVSNQPDRTAREVSQFCFAMCLQCDQVVEELTLGIGAY